MQTSELRGEILLQIEELRGKLKSLNDLHTQIFDNICDLFVEFGYKRYDADEPDKEFEEMYSDICVLSDNYYWSLNACQSLRETIVDLKPNFSNETKTATLKNIMTQIGSEEAMTNELKRLKSGEPVRPGFVMPTIKLEEGEEDEMMPGLGITVNQYLALR